MTTIFQSPIFRQQWPSLLMLSFFCVSLALKLSLLKIGAPYTTIDDHTTFEAGFMIWFGQAPPQRTYIESWLVGASSLLTYVGQLAIEGNLHSLNANVVADAYRSFTENPEPFVMVYRLLMLGIDLGTAVISYYLTLAIVGQHQYRYWLATFSAGLFLLSYNTIWCYLVARPDSATAFFTALGFLCYYQSHFAQRKGWFVGSAIALGIATGLKLHAAMAVIFIMADIWRYHGLRNNIGTLILFGTVSFTGFLIFAGTTLFDPLLYIKLRALNIRDDVSPWIQWGEQFLIVLKGTGWIIIPLILVAFFRHFFKKDQTLPERIKSALFISILFIISFCAIRQLRAYWMLPALPIFYSVAVYLLAHITTRKITFLLGSALMVIFLMQCISQVQDFSHARYNELRNWISNNVKSEEPIYIIGYNTLYLPCNTTCLQNRKASIQKKLEQSIIQNEPFTIRHVRLWEERTQLRLIEMLNAQSTIGFNYYGIHSTPLNELAPNVTFANIQYVLLMKGYDAPQESELIAQVKNEFDFVITANAPGGKAGTGGLPYDIYRRKQL